LRAPALGHELREQHALVGETVIALRRSLAPAEAFFNVAAARRGASTAAARCVTRR
jgi:hypothetical protein